MIASDLLSNADVASSRITIGAFLINAVAIAILCFVRLKAEHHVL